MPDCYYEHPLREGGRQALAECLRQTPAGSVSEQIATVRQPTLILWGGKDRLISPELAELFFHHSIAYSQVVMFAKLGHEPQEEEPVATAAVVKKFLGAPNIPLQWAMSARDWLSW